MLDRSFNIGYSIPALIEEMHALLRGGFMSIRSQEQETMYATPEDLHDYLVSLVKQATAAYLAQEHKEIDSELLHIDLRFSAQASFGDYSVPLMKWAGKDKLGRPPLVIAKGIAEILSTMKTPGIAEITVTPPGY